MSARKWTIAAFAICALLLSSSAASAGSLNLASSPYRAPSFSGGEFVAYDIVGAPVGSISTAAWWDRNANGVKDEFQTFCLERNENFPTFNKFTIDKGAIMGGLGVAGTYAGDPSGVGGYDPLSEATAYLYTQFWTGNLSSYDYVVEANREIDARSLQRAIWELENEGTPATKNADAQALAWISEATGAVASGAWSGLGNVRVLNLYTVDSVTGAITNRQSQLIIVPLPASAMMGLGLLCAIGAYRGLRRRRAI